MKKLQVFIIILLISSVHLAAQSTQIFKQYDKNFATAMYLYGKEHYGTAQKMFENIANDAKYENSAFKDDALYYASQCALKLFNKDAEYLIEKFINEHPESYNINDAYFQMGNHQFLKKRYPNALKYYAKVDRLSLSKEANSEYFFKMGYSHYARKDYDKASKMFYEIKDEDSFYAPLAEYFYSHIKYMNQQYQTALIGFQNIENNEWFSAIVPFYITQIYYMQEKYDEIIEYAPKVLEKENSSRLGEVNKILGVAYYRTGNFAQAINYLENAYAEDSEKSDHDNYELGFAYYQTKQYNKALGFFQASIGAEDSLTQNAAYHLADCYVKLDRKKDAKLAFGTASKFKFDKNIREDALFNFAKISYELDLSPFNEALNAFNTFLNEFPNSNKVDEVYDYMVQAFLTTKNYQDALNIMDKMASKPPKIESAYQRIAYLRGLEHFIDANFDKALNFFNKSLNYEQYDSQIKALCHYWKAEVYYRQQNYNEAIKLYSQFIELPGAVRLDEFALAHYHLGYSYFQKKDYQNAGNWFRKYERLYAASEPDKIFNDAMNRIGDCYFISKQFGPATDYYKKSARIGIYDADYAMYQMALGYGGQKQHQEKIWSLTKLVNEHPNSIYSGYANFEIARTYNTMTQRPDSAINYYNYVVENYKGSAMVKSALSDLATIYFNDKNYADALDTYKELIAQYPNSDEARSAKEMIKTIYIELNQTENWVDYANSQGGDMVVSMSEQDSLNFMAAQRLYVNKDYEKALDALTKYLNNFPKGVYMVDAHFYKAELLNYFDRAEEALPSYEIVANSPSGMYTEESVLKTASLYFLDKNYSKALTYYSKLNRISQVKDNILIARLGILRCNYLIESWEDVVTAAHMLISTDKVSDEMIKEARYDEAKARYELKQWMQAYNVFSSLASEVQSYQGAEARYRMAEIQMKIGEDTIAENMIYDFAQMSSPHRFWLAKGFILLSDIFLQRNDLFQAKHTLKSVVDNYTDDADGIKDEAYNKLAEITEIEKAEEQTQKFLQLEIDMGGGNDGYDDLLNIEQVIDDNIKNEIEDDIE
ncbi:MAG: tetratricopeptide repeat protein [Bacteroidales bacterium]|nr:tetratricopeptide repeat protein [Bacteroidales bacterium]